MTRHEHSSVPTKTVQAVLHRAFAPLHKRAFGTAVGVVSGAFFFGLTAVHILVASPAAANLELLSQYFYGYQVDWLGAFVGAWWGGIAGFVAGWFVAFLRNFVLATWLLVVKAKADLSETTDFLDHI